MLGLYWLRSHVLAFPIHPLGWAVSQMMLTRHMWFSVFLVWLVKAVLIRYGGPRLLSAVRPFFLGLILGQFATIALWLGHESIDTTHIYLEADLEAKERALQKLAPVEDEGARFTADDPLLVFLTSL